DALGVGPRLPRFLRGVLLVAPREAPLRRSGERDEEERRVLGRCRIRALGAGEEVRLERARLEGGDGVGGALRKERLDAAPVGARRPRAHASTPEAEVFTFGTNSGKRFFTSSRRRRRAWKRWLRTVDSRQPRISAISRLSFSSISRSTKTMRCFSESTE